LLPTFTLRSKIETNLLSILSQLLLGVGFGVGVGVGVGVLSILSQLLQELKAESAPPRAVRHRHLSILSQLLRVLAGVVSRAGGSFQFFPSCCTSSTM
jgi:hypothetical protein